MEPVSRKSAIKVARDTDITRVADTQMSFLEWNRSRLYPTTPVLPSSRQMSFQILPQNSELHPPSCELVVTFLVTKLDGTKLDKDTQISCINLLGITAWQSASVRIGGQTYLPEFNCSEHATFFKIHGCMTKREREIYLNYVGYEKDTDGKEHSEVYSADPNFLCKCGACNCWLKVVSSRLTLCVCVGETVFLGKESWVRGIRG